MRENFIIMERYKSRDFVLYHFVFAVNYVCDKNALYGISKIVPRDSQTNESNFEKIDLWGISQASRTAKTPSIETSIPKELALIILRL